MTKTELEIINSALRIIVIVLCARASGAKAIRTPERFPPSFRELDLHRRRNCLRSRFRKISPRRMDAHEALRSKIHAIISDVQHKTGEAVRRNDTAMAARQMYGSSARINESWKAIRENGIEAAYELIDACTGIGGMRNAEEIDAIVIPEYECFLRSWKVASGNSLLERHEEDQHRNARTFVSRIQSEVRTRVFEAEKRDAKEAAALEAMKPKPPAAPAPWWTHLGPISKAIEALLKFLDHVF